jgi:N-acetylglutamate synthase-like GNAT family acetyltransferase
MKVIEPKTSEELAMYYQLRWEVLRKPWGKPRGSELDEQEEQSIHAMLVDDNNEGIAVGRLQMNSPVEAQLRFMGVRADMQGKRLGDHIISYLEGRARAQGAKKLILQARQNAVSFYERNGYRIKEKSFLLWDEIQHYLMEKEL